MSYIWYMIKYGSVLGLGTWLTYNFKKCNGFQITKWYIESMASDLMYYTGGNSIGGYVSVEEPREEMSVKYIEDKPSSEAPWVPVASDEVLSLIKTLFKKSSDSGDSMLVRRWEGDDEKIAIINKSCDVSGELVDGVTPVFFIQVELDQKDKKVDIHGKLKPFYIEGNVLLDAVFLKWYLKEYYDIELEPEYTLNIIDRDIKLFTLNEEQSIVLKSDGWDVKSKEKIH